MKRKILIGCAKSGVMAAAWEKVGWEATECDILPGTHIRHIQDNVLNHLNDGWDAAIFHPPCTYLSHAGARWLYPNHILNQDRYSKGLAAKEFFMMLWSSEVPFIAIENPQPQKVYQLPKESQIIQPYQFGHHVQKKTYLWLKGFPLLQHTKLVEPQFYIDGKGIRHTILNNWNAEKASRTFEGIAEAMASQWGNLTPELLLSLPSASLQET